MAIRIAQRADIPRLVELGAAMHAASRQRVLAYDATKVAGYFALSIECPRQYTCVVATHDDDLVGFLIGYLEEYVFARAKLAYDTVFWVEPAHRNGVAARGLIDAFERWAREQGAVELYLGISSGIAPDRTAKLYEHLGFTREGAIYRRALSERGPAHG